ncbi:MAG: hypothetical protein C0601_04230 [Candidatus Muiribacterium halophilum]|uniref:Uncharacterized protein n=1 Tax=Muiribacterium halophilum TaxID=2053465 RepID=A0A2N5ZIU3_MUIH1|nr:MAG: hypothetical protein C0601_04230 [Candidatus Muirbacterium halophilum]
MENHKKYVYRFKIRKDLVEQVEINLSFPKLALDLKPIPNAPKWTHLDFKRCPNCKLDLSKNRYCPIAYNLLPYIKKFKDYMTFKEIEIDVITKERTYSKKTSMADGLSSLFGLVMASSGCPDLDWLRPMVNTHLPFATGSETAHRALSTYVLAQYYRKKKGLEPDFELNDLVNIYKEISIINSAFLKRLKGNNELTDSMLEPLQKLSCFTIFTVASIEDKFMKEIKDIFYKYIN